MLLDPAQDPQVKELTAQTETLLEVGSNYRVANAGDYQVAGIELQRVKGAQKRLDDLRKSMTKPLDAAKKAIMDFFRTPEDKLARAESGIKRAMIGYQSEQDRKRREEQARVDEAARKERERLAAQAQKAAASGKVERAEQLEQRASAVVAPVISREPPKVIGVQTREVWKFEVTNPDLVPRQFLSVDDSKIRKVVGALKGDTKIDGVRIWSERAIAAGSGAGQ
jgi:hypothetical protein